MKASPDILIVEDDSDIRDAVAALLEDHGVLVATAHDGADAMPMMLEAPPRVVLLDLMIPHMSGDDVLAAMQADPSLASIPVVVMTASVDRSGTLRKPFQAADLFRALAPFLPELDG